MTKPKIRIGEWMPFATYARGIINYGGLRLKDYIVATDGIFGDGLTAENVEQAVAILKRREG